jgi:hypothetical protein
VLRERKGEQGSVAVQTRPSDAGALQVVPLELDIRVRSDGQHQRCEAPLPLVAHFGQPPLTAEAILER